MKMRKSASTQATGDQMRTAGRTVLSENLRKQRLADEDARKASGLWGELSVVTIEHGSAAFVHLAKGGRHNDYATLSRKRPTEIPKHEHALLSEWLQRRQYEGFKSTVNAWNVSLDEAKRIKSETIANLQSAGTQVLNTSG